MVSYTSWPERFPENFTYGSTKAGLEDLGRCFWARYNQLTGEMKSAIDQSHYWSGLRKDYFTLTIGFKDGIDFICDDVFNEDEYYECKVYFFADHTEIDWVARDASGEHAELSGNFLFDDCNKEATKNAYIELFKKVPDFNNTVMNAFETLLQLVAMPTNLPDGIYLK